MKKKRINTIYNEFSLSQPTAKKYIYMSEDEIKNLDSPTYYKKKKTVMDEYLNIIYKMLRDNRKPEIIMAYVIRKGYNGSLRTLEKYIKLLAKNNFNRKLSRNWAFEFAYPNDLTVIRRNELLKYITTKNPETKKNEVIERNLEVIKEKYAIVHVLKDIYDEFYDILMESASDKLDSFMDKYKDSELAGFIDGLLNDISAVKNAISHTESNGFVEGNNNKFKLIKRILYGRANLPYLFKKSYLAFKFNTKDFDLAFVL